MIENGDEINFFGESKGSVSVSMKCVYVSKGVSRYHHSKNIKIETGTNYVVSNLVETFLEL